MKNVKKLLALLLAMAMVFSMAACGSSAASSVAENASAAEAASAGEAAPAAPAASGSAIKLGGIGPITGGAAIYGNATKNGAQIAVDEINALGGLQLSLDFQDDEGDAEKAVNAYHKLQGDGAQLIYGCTTTTPCVAVSA